MRYGCLFLRVRVLVGAAAPPGLAPPRPGDAQPEEPRPAGQEAGTDFYLPEDGVEGFDMLEAMGSATPRAVNQLLPSGFGR